MAHPRAPREALASNATEQSRGSFMSGGLKSERGGQIGSSDDRPVEALDYSERSAASGLTRVAFRAGR